MKSSFIIQKRQPWRRMLAMVAAGIAIGAGGYALSEREHETRDQQVKRLQVEQKSLLRDNRQLSEENDDLKARVAILERSKQIDSKAYADLDAYLKQLREEILELREEVAFYRGIVSSNETKGVLIHTFIVEREGKTDAYRYSLVLTRNMRNDRLVSGTVNLSVSGEMHGDLKQLSLKEVSDSEDSALKFRFKHFQRLEGRMTLPKGFVPHRVVVNVQTRGGRRTDVEKAFDWSRAVG
ncbi:MAG: DUF6776 family protein [Gammaproteobacteria bacterium]|nr:DUF6776 family protein [Gammaproteobacteria bacterium]